MLVLSRKTNESIVINQDITVVVMGIQGNKVRLGFEAPAEVAILRDELNVGRSDVNLPDTQRIPS